MMMRIPRPAFVLVVLLVSLIPLGAEDPVLPVAADLADRIGLTPDEAFGVLGTPSNIFPYRGETETEDSVVFFYDDRTYIFWFRDRVWQARVDSLWPGDVDGVSMGMTLDEVVEAWGRNPINDSDPAPTWTLPDRGYPVRIRLYFDDNGLLNDLYVFRSDW